MPAGYDMDTSAVGGFGPYPGQDQINSFIVARDVVLTQPNIIYIVAGTNPLGGSESNSGLLETTIQEMERGIREIAQLSPNSHILLGAVPTSASAPNLMATYNQRQEALAAELKVEGISIDFWNAQTTLSELRDNDNLHMSDAGMIRFGQVAFAAGDEFFLSSGACAR
jgi:lysophospholipase L1-like esterase